MIERPWLAHYDQGVPEHIDYPAVPVFAFFDDTSRRFPELPCTVFQDHAVSYGQMRALVDRLAAGFERAGVKKGDRVGVALPNLPQFVLVYYAALKAGGVVVAMNPSYKQPELEFIARDAGVSVLVGLSESADLLRAVQQAQGIRTLILTALADAFEIPAWLEQATRAEKLLPECALRDLLTEPGALPQTVVGPDDVAIFQYSGGTTGAPKAAIALHRNLVANSLMFRRWLVGLQAGQETTLMAIPLFHVYGMVVGMSVSILLGAKMVLIPDSRRLDEILRNIETYRASFFPGVPTLYALIGRDPDVLAGRYDLRSVKACISGSAPLLKAVQERFEQLTGAKLMEGYGLSEAPTATHCNPMYGEKRPGSIGLPLPDVDCRIASVEEDETPLPPGEAGELLIRSPQVMQGYYHQPEETEVALRGGWLHTGDIARMDADGYFYIIDRKKDLIKVSGFQVWPREIEEVIAAHPKVIEAGVAGIPDPIRGEAPKAWVALKPGESSTEEEIRAWCERSLVYYKVPVAVQFVSALPRSGVGKLLRRELKNLAR